MPNIQVDWGVKGDSGLEGVWNGTGIDIDPVNAGVAVLRATRPGRESVTSSVRISSAISLADQYKLTNDKTLLASIDIIVVESLQFTKPSV